MAWRSSSVRLTLAAPMLVFNCAMPVAPMMAAPRKRAEDEGEGQFRRVQPVVAGERHVGRGRLVRLRSLVAPVAGPEGAPGALRPLAAEVLPRQGAGRQGGIGRASRQERVCQDV